MKSDKRDEEQDIEDRNLAMFKRWLAADLTFEQLAQEFNLSLSRVYEVAKEDRWAHFRRNDKVQRYRDVAREVKRCKDLGEVGPGHPDWPGGWRDYKMPMANWHSVFPFDGVHKRLVKEDHENQIIHVQIYYPKG